MNPVVLVKSFGSIKSTEIIKSIVGHGTPEDIELAESHYSTYPYEIKTKYYRVPVTFFPFENELSKIPAEVLDVTEALIVFFDAEDKSFLAHIPELCSIAKRDNISLGMFLTTEFADSSDAGPTYEEVKNECKNLFDLMELCSESNGDKDDSAEQHKYQDVIEALHNNIWSNVKMPSTGAEDAKSSMHMESVEDQLEAFEDLITSIQNFKEVSSTLSREEVLDQAEKLAELFASIVNED